jgi:hypothetical protein
VKGFDETIATLKLEVIGRVVERLARMAGGGGWATVDVEPLVAELREIIDAPAPVVTDPTEQAMAELALWARRHAGAVPAESLEAALLAELVSLQLDAGRTLTDYRHRCDAAWHSIRRIRQSLDGAGATD